MEENNLIKRLLGFLDASPVNFLAARNIADSLAAAGYRHLDPREPLGEVKAGDKFYVTKNDSSVYAFHIGRKPMADAGFHIICAHCDSPTFRIKPNAEMRSEGGIVKLNTEVYGGPIMSTWFDRPLTVAGRVILRGEYALSPRTCFVHARRPLLQISNLAIHFNRQVNDGVKLSKQKDMLPLLGIVSDTLGQRASAHDEAEGQGLLMRVICEELAVGPDDILDFDLYLADATAACTFGANDEFISSGRLDDLSMCHAGLEAMLATPTTDATKVLAIFDNEETGSQTKQGAASPFLAMMLQRICASQDDACKPGERSGLEAFCQAVERAFMISADNAHAWHPNYGEKYDPTNHPLLGGGPVIKFNAAQKYASDAVSAAIFAEICREAQVPCQRFVNHSDVAGGSTLGNILASSLPMRGVDMGNPILAMHSCRETGAVADHIYCVKAFTTFFSK
ncbi:MAG: M18 family aminopeptidase [Bacteroidaceae bacterium]|nr:M18 family aminopeptidase [Bacteroidaceae bacterium]